MGISLEELWKNSGDEEVTAAIEKWATLNDETKRIIVAEAKRRGLSVTIPEPPPAAKATAVKAPAAAPNVWNATTWVIIAVVVAAVIALVKFV